MVARSIKDVEKVWLAVDGVKKVSDRIVGLGPFGIGLDGLISMLNFVPLTAPLGIAADEVFTVGAGFFLVSQAVQGRASPAVVTRMITYLVLDTAVGVIPVIGGVLDVFFQGHMYAARALQKEIERTHWVEESWSAAKASGAYVEHRAEMKAQKKKRVVYLHD